MSTSTLDAVLARLESIASRLERVESALAHSGTSSQTTPVEAEELSPAVVEFDELVTGINEFFTFAATIGGLVNTQCQAFKEALSLQRALLILASKHSKPADSAMTALVQPLQAAVAAVQSVAEKNSRDKDINHLKALQESSPALLWVLMAPKPGPYVKEMLDAGVFWAQKVQMANKNDPTQVGWVNAFKKIFNDLQAFIKKNHTTGLSWNARGSELPSGASLTSGSSSSSSSTTTAAAASSNAPQAPPAGKMPPLQLTAQTTSSASSASSGAKMTDVFADLNKGTSVTSGLRKVTDDMKTKNRTDKVSVVTERETPAVSSSSTGAARSTTTAVSKPPRMERLGLKWEIENYVGNKNIVLEDVNSKQTVYVYNCNDCVISVRGKINQIAIDKCNKTGIILQEVVSGAQIVNSKRCQIQCGESCPSVAIDECAGIQVYLGANSLGCQIISSKSCEMNVLIPAGTDDWTEISLPEQYKSTIVNGKVVTESVSHG